MGRLDSAVFSVRCPRRPEKPLVLMRLSVGRGRNVQGATVVCGTVFCSLAVVAKKMEPRAPCACRIHRNGVRDRIAVAPAHTGVSSLLFLRRKGRYRSTWIIGTIGCAAFVIGAFVGGSFAWLRVGFL